MAEEGEADGEHVLGGNSLSSPLTVAMVPVADMRRSCSPPQAAASQLYKSEIIPMCHRQ